MVFPLAEMLFIKEATVFDDIPVKLCSGSFLPPLSSWPWCSWWCQVHSHPSFPCWQDILPLSGEHAHKLGLLGFNASGFSLASWPTSSSTPLQTKIDSIIRPSQSSKNVNTEQKLPVLHISEGLFENRAFLKLILLRAWPRPFLSTPFSKATVQGSAP